MSSFAEYVLSLRTDPEQDPALTATQKRNSQYIALIIQESYRPLPKEKSPWISPETTRGILNAEIGLTQPKARQFILASYGAIDWMIVAMRNPITGATGLIHIHPFTDWQLTG
jgi:hypothetical protein